jgi:hypothetical protein
MQDRIYKLAVPLCALALAACSMFEGVSTSSAGAVPVASGSGAVSNRPDGEGYAGRGELVVRLTVPAATSKLSLPGMGEKSDKKLPDRAVVDLRYLGLDSQGRAVFQRHDVDTVAGAPETPAALAGAADVVSKPGEGTDAPIDTRDIVLDLRLVRQIHIQDKVIEVVEATPSGVVFRLY